MAVLRDRQIEQQLFNELAKSDDQPRPFFILGAPRTGSTLLYQIIASSFRLPYISNLTNDHFGKTPIVGLALQNNIQAAIPLQSDFGKTRGPWQPSEGSAVMSHWFGGGHPSETVSARILEGREPHMISTLRAVEALYGKPLLVKNAWNCFRVPYLAEALPEARFIWIRRDIAAAARSDLEARYATKGSADEWNSATPANVAVLKKLPPAQQVVENQYEFSRAIGGALRDVSPERQIEVWYDDLVTGQSAVLRRVGKFIGLRSVAVPQGSLARQPRVSSLSPAETAAIMAHVASDDRRFDRLRRTESGEAGQSG